MTRRMYDAAYPPAHPPKWEAVAAYIGGDTPHVWTIAEWNAQPARWRLPIYVRSNPGSHSPHVDAAAAIAWLRPHKVPHGCLVALDLETAVNAAYVRAFDTDVLAAGWKTCAYGSLSTIFKNPKPSGGYWVAHYTGTPHMEAGAVATQYANDRMLHTDYDASLITDSAPLWDTRPEPQPTPLEDDMAYGGQIPAGKGQQINVSFPHGSMKAVGFVIDNSVAIDGVIAAEPQAQVRYAFHRKAGTWQTGTVKVGSADDGKDHSPKTVVALTNASDVDYASFIRLDDGTRPVGWDMS